MCAAGDKMSQSSRSPPLGGGSEFSPSGAGREPAYFLFLPWESAHNLAHKRAKVWVLQGPGPSL